MNPALRVEVTRGAIVESAHHVHAVVMSADERIIAGFGDHELPVFPRSAVKPMQALPLLETGAADAFGLGDERIALACASHDHERVHLQTVRAWLADIGCSPADLGCGVQPPGDACTIAELAMRGEHADAVYNNCSGKHAGLLTVARYLGEPLSGYTARDHPVQARVRRVLGEMTDTDADAAAWGLDGCSIPSLALPLRAWALGMARMADPSQLPATRVAAIRRINHAIAAEPLMIGGEQSWDSQLIRALDGRLLVKGGAEGVACGWLPEAGLGFCLKVQDGAARAAQVAVGCLLDRLQVFDAATRERGQNVFAPRLYNWNGREVGVLRMG